jgi:hypothetical protein
MTIISVEKLWCFNERGDDEDDDHILIVCIDVGRRYLYRQWRMMVRRSIFV